MWAGGGSWDDGSSSSSSSSSAPAEPDPLGRTHGAFGADRRRAATGLVAGRFLPLHRGHQYMIDFARASVERLVVLVFTAKGDAIAGKVRVAWLRELYPEVTVTEVASTLGTGDADLPAKFAKLVAPHAGKPELLFSSETWHREAAKALGAAFVPVDPGRIAVPISGSAIRANVVEHFAHVAPPARPWLIRRIAVVGAESTGKSTLCARLRDELGALLVPEWTRTLIESGGASALDAELVQLVARSQIASEDALAAQASPGGSGILVCDTELHTLDLWMQRLYTNSAPAWISEQSRARTYDLYLLCAPDIPFIGAPARDQPEQRTRLHQRFVETLSGRNVVELTGSRDERFRAAADAIITLHAPSLLSARGEAMARALG
jgi:NadR type nicotinamide-nucleotide adenylyltransferase